MSQAFGFGINGLLSGAACDRALLQAQIATLKPAAQAVDPNDVACFKANADLIPDDYAALMVEAAAATSAGKKSKLAQYGIGAACGLALGVIVGKFVL